MGIFGDTERATYIDRPNRFTIRCLLGGKRVRAYLPNPGRLWELLIPGTTVFLERAGKSGRTLQFTAVAVLRSGGPVMLHTHKTNDVAATLIENDLIPGLEGARIKAREARLFRSRIDFLLDKGRKEIYLEVKSCTLFGNRVAMFPDAVTDRGRRHLQELAALKNKKGRGALLFIVNGGNPDFFLPEYHTDLEFSRAFLGAKKKLMIIPLAVRWGKNLTLEGPARHLTIPWNLLERESRDRGCYLIILRLPAESAISVGKLGTISFQGGYYVYVGSAKKNLASRISRHRRLRKNRFWHVDYLREAGEFVASLPVRTGDDIECEIARSVGEISQFKVPSFGASDCACPSHLFRFPGNPIHNPAFHHVLQYYRMERLVENR